LRTEYTHGGEIKLCALMRSTWNKMWIMAVSRWPACHPETLAIHVQL